MEPAKTSDDSQSGGVTARPSPAPTKIGILAGQGQFPLLIGRAARSAGVEVVTIAFNGFASPEVTETSDKVEWVELGQVGRVLELLHAHGIKAVAMAGRIPHSSIFQYRHFDARALKMLTRAVTRRADSLLGVVTQELEGEGIQVLDSSLYLKSLMPPPGLITRNRPLDEREMADVEFAYPIAKVIAGQDIGQTIVVKEQVVVAVEGLEGTDECIRRAGKLAGPGCVVMKVSKPRQDFRFDIPVIGRGTVEALVEAACSALAVNARECLIFDRDEVVRDAEAANIGIIAVEEPNATR